MNLHEDCIVGGNVGWGPKSKFLSFAEFDPFDVMWVLSDKLLRYNTETLEFAGRGDMDSLFWNPKNSLNWIKGEFYFIAHRTRIGYDTLYHNDSMYFDVIPRYILGKASIARLDTNDASNSIILFDYPDTTAVILNMLTYLLR